MRKLAGIRGTRKPLQPQVEISLQVPRSGRDVVVLSRVAPKVAAQAFSRRTPLNFLAPFFTAMNSPDVLSRLVQAGLPITAVLRCVRFFTAPLRALSPTGLFFAIIPSRCMAAQRRLRLWNGATVRKVPRRGTNRTAQD